MPRAAPPHTKRSVAVRMWTEPAGWLTRRGFAYQGADGLAIVPAVRVSRQHDRASVHAVSITHIATGRGVMTTPSLEAAEELLWRIRNLADWTGVPDKKLRPTIVKFERDAWRAA